jgi:hypothetical protein
MQEYTEVIFDGDVPLSSIDIYKSLFAYLRGNKKYTSVTIGITEPGTEFGDWKISRKDYKKRKEYCVFYRRDLNNVDDDIDLGCIEIDFDISETKPPCHLKVISHKESYDYWWKKFLEENLRRTEDVIVHIDPIEPLRKNEKIEDKDPYIYVPTVKKYLDRYKEAYNIFIRVDKYFHNVWEDDTKRNPKPKFEDYIDALSNEMQWKPTSKTIERIIAAGEIGFRQKVLKKK